MIDTGNERSQEFFDTFMAEPERSLERLDQMMMLEDTNGALDQMANYMLADAIPVIFANHQSFADGLALIHVTQLLTDETDIEGFKIPSSAGAESQPLHEVLSPVYESCGLYPVGVYTEEEIAVLREGAARKNRTATIELVKAPAHNFGLALFPEASPNGGIKNPDGTIRGMQQVVRDDLRGYATIYTKRYSEREVVFLPVGIHGTYEIYDPESNLPGPHAIEAVCDGTDALWPFVDIKVGEPIPVDEIVGDYNTFLMSAVAKLLPEEARGFYR